METDRKDRKFIYTDSSASRSNFKSMKNSFKPNSQLKNSNACQL